MIGPLITEGYLSDEDVVNPYSRKKRSQSHASDPKEKTLRKSSGDVTLLRKYERGQGNNPSEWKEPSHKRLRTTMQKVERNVRTAMRRMVRAELLEGAAITQEGGGGLLEATEPGEKTYTLRQDQLVAEVDAQSARKRYDLHLPTFGPYVFGYSKNGNALSLLGQKGHLATIYWKKASLQSELQLKERCTDVTYLHDDRLLAVAQKKYTYIYSAQDGTEVHQLRCMAEVVQLEFLPEHFLLCGANRAGLLSWFDVSTGKVAGTQRSRMGTPNALRRDPSTNVLGVAHTNGTVTFWSPKVEKPLVRLAAHRGPVLDMSFDLRSGSHYLATVGCDARTRIWDLRTMMPLHHLTTVSGTSVDLSYTGLLAVGFGHRVEVWKDLLHEGGHTCPNLVRKPYMAHNHDAHTTINYRVRFCPYEDVLGVSHTNGFSSFLIPGAGCAVPDFYTADVFESRRGKAERPVQMLLDKLSPDMISWETKFPKQELAESGAMTAQRKKREARQRRRAARDAREVNEEESWEVQPKDLETRSISSDDSSDMDTTEEKDIEKVLSDQIAAEDKDSTRLRDKIRVKRERRLRRLEGTKRFQVLQRRKGRHTIRLTRRRVRKETESREGTREEVGDGISQNTVKRPATKIRNLAMERFKKKK